jgi:hypothetical protein
VLWCLRQDWQHYVLRITTLTTIFVTYHYIDNNMSYVSQHYQQYVLCITTLTTKYSSWLWYVRHIVVSFVIRKPYCCHGCDTYDILLSILWYVRHIVVNVMMRKTYCCLTTLTTICFTHHSTDNDISYASQQYQQYVLCITTLTTICLTYHNTDRNMSYVSQHWQQ